MLGRRREPSTPIPASEAAVAARQPVAHMRLGELLLDSGEITQQQLDDAIAKQKIEGGFIGQLLVKLGHVSQEQVASCLVKQCKIPHLSLLDYDIGPEVISLVPEEVCRRYSLLPIDKLGRILTVAMVDPLDLEALEAIRAYCPDLRIKPILCNWEHFELTSNKVFRKKGDSGKMAVTASSFGLRDEMPNASAPVAPATPAPAAAPAPAPAVGVADLLAPPPAVAASASMDNAALAGAIRDGVREAMREAIEVLAPRAPAEPLPVAAPAPSSADLVAAMKTAFEESIAALAERFPVPAAAPAIVSAAPAAAGPDPQHIADAIRDSVGGALQEAMAAMIVQLRAHTPAAPGPAGPSAEQMAEVIQHSVATAVQQTVGALHEPLRALQETLAQRPEPTANAPMQAAPAGPSPHEIAVQMGEVIRDSVGGAMQEAMATMVVQLRAMQGKAAPDAEQFGAMLQESVVAALQASQQATAEQLQQVTQAALASVQQAAQLIEATAVNEQTRRDLAGRQHRRAHNSVTPFGGSAPDEHTHADADARVLEAMESEKPIEAFTFDSFFAGKVNAFTYKVGQAVAASPGTDYNPFFLYGDVGVGKTHLISAIGNHVLQQNPGMRTGYVSASHFSRRLHDASKAGALDAFRENYCHWDVLILDDIQFLGGRVEAQEEFFHIFNVLRDAGRQIIIAGDKAPDRLGLLEQRLVSRFSSGIVAQLKSPEWETRVQILRHQAQRQSAQVPEEILSLIALRVTNDTRKMAGALRKIVAFANLVGQEMSCELAEEILSHLGAEQAA